MKSLRWRQFTIKFAIVCKQLPIAFLRLCTIDRCTSIHKRSKILKKTLLYISKISDKQQPCCKKMPYFYEICGGDEVIFLFSSYFTLLSCLLYSTCFISAAFFILKTQYLTSFRRSMKCLIESKQIIHFFRFLSQQYKSSSSF